MTDQMTEQMTEQTLECGCQQTKVFKTDGGAYDPTKTWTGDWKTGEACGEHGYPWQTKLVEEDEFAGYLIRERLWTGIENGEKPLVLDVEVYEYSMLDLKTEPKMTFQKRDATSR